MKKNFTLLLCLITFSVTATAQPTIQWQKLLGGTNTEDITPFKMQPTSDGGYITAGWSNSSNNGTLTGVTGNGGYDGWIIKQDANGNVMWQKLLGGTGDDRLHGIQQTSDGGYIVTGEANFNNTGTIAAINSYGNKTDAWVVKLDAAGNIMWQKNYGGSGEEYAQVISQTTDGGYIISGVSNSSNSGTLTGVTGNGRFDGWIMKLDASGNVTWQKLLGSFADDQLIEVRQTTDGGYVTAGYAGFNDGTLTGVTSNGTIDGWIVKLDASGNTTWQKLLGGSNGDFLFSIQQTADGGYITSGFSQSSNNGTLTGFTNNGNYDGWAIKLDASGNTTWQKLLGGNDDDRLYGARQTNDGGYVFVGVARSINTGTLTGITNNGNEDGWVIITDAAGNTRYQQLFGGNAGDFLITVEPTPNGYIMVGSSGSSNSGTFTGITGNGGFDAWILKLLKAVTTTSITSSLNPSIAGQSITFTATISTASAPQPVQ